MPLRKLVFCIAIIVITLLLTSCGKLFVVIPVYEMTGDIKDDEVCVDIDGVGYKAVNDTKWNILPGEETIGVAGTQRWEVINAMGDTERNFVLLKEPGFWDGTYYRIFRRTDRQVPEPSGDSVNSLQYYEHDFHGEEIKQLLNTINDKEIINQLFEILNTGTRVKEAASFGDFNIAITGFSDAVPGAAYLLSVEISGGKLVCGNYDEGYVEIPTELLESIAGYDIDVNKLLNDR